MVRALEAQNLIRRERKLQTGKGNYVPRRRSHLAGR
jgi:hypothetical protein